MSKSDEDPETSHWQTISAEELAASRRQAIRERLTTGPRDWLHDFIIAMQAVFESQRADDSLDAAERERAEANLETLRNQAPALILLLDQLPSGSRDGAFSIVFNLLAAVRGRIASTRAQAEERSHETSEAAVETRIRAMGPNSQAFAKEFVKEVQNAQAATARKGKIPLSAEQKEVSDKYMHLPWTKAQADMNAELTMKRLRPISRTVFHRRKKSWKSRS